MFKVTEEPRIEIMDIFGVMFIALGYILFLAVLHLLTINESGTTQSVLNAIFIVFLYIFYTGVIFTGAYVVIHFLRWLTWSINTPGWVKEEQKEKARLYGRR